MAASVTSQTMMSDQEVELLLALMETLRADGGLAELVDLPCLVAAGDQSSGKSSVLSAICGYTFLASPTTCTRFPHELHITSGLERPIEFRVVPDEARGHAEKEALRKLYWTLSDESDINALTRIVKEAEHAMGVGGPSQPTFVSDRLHITMTKPKIKPMLLIDLPGFFQASGGAQTKADGELVKRINMNIMSNDGVAILAIVSGKSEVVLQPVLDYAAEVDPQKVRTMGIITKPDMAGDVVLERKLIHMAENKDPTHCLFHGWHLLRNKTYNESKNSHAQRDQTETDFFLQEPWTQLPPGQKGIDNLLARLSKFYIMNFKRALPSLEAKIRWKIATLENQRRDLPMKGDAMKDKSAVLNLLYKLIENLTNHVNKVTRNSSPLSELRGLVTDRLKVFKKDVQQAGQLWQMVEDGNSTAKGSARISTCRSKFTEEVEAMVNEENDLKYHFNPRILSQLFYAEVESWPGLADKLVADLLAKVEVFLRSAVSATAPSPDICALLLDVVLLPALQDVGGRLRQHVATNTTEYRDQADITFNEEITGLIVGARRSEDVKAVQAWMTVNVAKNTGNAVLGRNLDLGTAAGVESFAKDVINAINVDRGTAAVYVACLLAYHKSELVIFDQAFTRGSFASNLLRDVGQLFSVKTVTDLSDERMQLFITEDAEYKAEQERINLEVGRLQSGLRAICDVQQEIDLLAGGDE